MNKIYSIDDKRFLRVFARNFKDNELLNVEFTLYNRNLEKIGKIKDNISVKNSEAKYSFTPRDLANKSEPKVIFPNNISFIKGWIDANDNGKEDYDEAVVYRVGVFDFIGLGLVNNTNKVYLLSMEDLKEYEYLNSIQIGTIKKNPINEKAKDLFSGDNLFFNFIKGFISMGGSIYSFGNTASRYTGFMDHNIGKKSIFKDLKYTTNKDKLTKDTEFTYKLISAISTNKYGIGEMFIQALIKNGIKNPEYLVGRATSNHFLSKKIVDKLGLDWKEYGMKTKISIGFLATYSDFLYAIQDLNTSIEIEEIEDLEKLIDLFADYVMKGQI